MADTPQFDLQNFISEAIINNQKVLPPEQEWRIPIPGESAIAWEVFRNYRDMVLSVDPMQNSEFTRRTYSGAYRAWMANRIEDLDSGAVGSNGKKEESLEYLKERLAFWNENKRAPKQIYDWALENHWALRVSAFDRDRAAAESHHFSLMRLYIQCDRKIKALARADRIFRRFDEAVENMQLTAADGSIVRAAQFRLNDLAALAQIARDFERDALGQPTEELEAMAKLIESQFLPPEVLVIWAEHLDKLNPASNPEVVDKMKTAIANLIEGQTEGNSHNDD